METRQYEIECGRCGETRLEVLTEAEARAIGDGIGPASRQCERCGKTTGWIKARRKSASTDEAVRRSTHRESAVGPSAERLVQRGQERMATQSERDEVAAILHRPDATRMGDADRRGRDAPDHG